MTTDRKPLLLLVACMLVAALGLAACGGDDEATTEETTAVVVTDANGNTTTTTTTDVRTAEAGGPGDAPPTVASCIQLWNGANNVTNQSLLAKDTEPGDDAVINVTPNVATQPPTCFVTLISGDEATQWAEAAGQDFPYAAPTKSAAGEVDAKQRADNADVDQAGKLKAAG